MGDKIPISHPSFLIVSATLFFFCGQGGWGVAGVGLLLFFLEDPCTEIQLAPKSYRYRELEMN
jgi:hypothetical protein